MAPLRTFIAALALAAATPAAHADIPDALDRATVSVGGFYPIVDARLSADGPEVSGSDIDFQRDLGLDKHRTLTNLRLDLLVFDSQGFSIGGYKYSKEGSATLVRDIRFAGNSYDVDAFVDAGLSLTTYNAAWHWWFAPDDDDALGIGLGAVYYDLRGSISGRISIDGGTGVARGSVDGSAIAPLLTLGWRHAFTPDLRAYAEFAGVRKASGTLTGHLLNGTLGLEYYPWRNLGLALEYSANNLDLKADKASWEGRARIHFHGPAAFVRLRF
jgi:hypothetical protein